MPAYLSEGSRRFGRAQADDPISRLDYYVSSSSMSSHASNTDRSHDRPKWAPSSGASASSYSPSLARLLRTRPCVGELNDSFTWRGPADKSSERALRKRQVRKQPERQLKGDSLSSSPPASSGFSENCTLAEKTSIEHFNTPPYQIELQKAELVSSLRRRELHNRIHCIDRFEPKPKSLSNESSTNKRRSDDNSLFVGRFSSPKNRQLLTRVQRRNANRMKRRLVMSNEHLINPYALSELFSQSEIPGFREIFASDSYLRKFCWIVAFLFMTVLSLNDMTELITEYYDYPITVDVRHRDSARLPFPAVTVCNLNVVRFSALCSSTPNSIGHELTNQIPSELRDRLCGIQVEKKNSTESDINDINNIGISTSPAPSSPSQGVTTELWPSSPMSGQDANATTSAWSRPVPSEEPNMTSSATAGYQSSRTPTTYQASTAVTANPASSGHTSTRRSTAAGGLDLGDFALQPMPIMDRNQRHSAGKPKRLLRRSINPDESSSDQPRPFASRSARIRLRTALESKVSPSGPPRTNILDDLQRKRAAMASQNNKHTINLQASRGGPSGSPHGVRNVGLSANSITPNPIQYPSGSAGFAPQTSSATLNATTYSPTALPEDGYELTERQERELQENLTNWLAVMYNRDPELTRSLGHQFDDMILRCSMKHINCTHQRSFENSFSPTEGNCFTYRSRVKRRSSSRGSQSYEDANLAGTSQGLELVLNLEKNEYIAGSSQVGALVMIHHPSDLSYAASEATFVAPEFTTYIGLKMVNITRLPAPYPEYCVDSWPAKFADTLTRNSTYSQQACLKICLQRTIQSHCQCQSAFLPVVELDSSVSGRTNQSAASATEKRAIICDTRKLVTRQCVKEVMFRAADRVHNCDCPPKCQVVRYDKTISMARWPTREDKVTFDRGKLDVNFQNLAKVIVYFQTMTCEEVTQQAVFNAAKLFSALGGIMGMYVGFSFLSVFEIFEVMSRKIWHHFTLKLSNNRLAR